MHRRDHDATNRTHDLPPAASFSTDGIPATDRLTFFRDAFLQTVTPAEVYGDPDPEFSARMKMDEFGMVTLTGVVTGSRRRRGLRRTPELIRRCDPRGYRLVLYQQGGATLAHNHHQIRLTPGDMTLVDTSRPYDGWDAADSSRFLSVEFPRGLLPLRDSVDRLCGARLSGRTGVGALVWAFTKRLAQDIAHYRPPDAMRVSTTLLELMRGLRARTRREGDPAGRVPSAGAVPRDPGVHRTTPRRSRIGTVYHRRSAPHLPAHTPPPLRIERCHRRRLAPYATAEPLPARSGGSLITRAIHSLHCRTLGAAHGGPFHADLPSRLRTESAGLSGIDAECQSGGIGQQ
jgi:hypothetical protein